MQKSVIIVAGGKGLRMGTELPKQFIPIAGKPVLMHTIEAFYHFDNSIKIIVVLHESYVGYWNELCRKYHFEISHISCIGGETRFHSVKNGLQWIEKGELVAVHDAARPFASVTLIKEMYKLAIIHKAVIPVVDVTDSLREIVENKKSRLINRSRIKSVQTPQVFYASILKDAYETDFFPSFTDDASVVEQSGQDIFLAKGEFTNIKITTPFDLEIARLLVKSRI